MTSPKLPTALLATGASVAVRLPLQRGVLAHKPATDKRKTGRKHALGRAIYQDISVAACDPEGPSAPLFSAAWANHMGAVACTELACFPDA